MAWIPEKPLLRTFRNGFYQVLDYSKRVKEIDKNKIFDSELLQYWDVTTSRKNAQSAKDKLGSTMDAGQTNCDLNDENGDVVSNYSVIVKDDKSKVDTRKLSETSNNEMDHSIKPITSYSLDVNNLSQINDLRTEVTKLWSCVHSTQNANNSQTLQELDTVKTENHTLQQEFYKPLWFATERIKSYSRGKRFLETSASNSLQRFVSKLRICHAT